MMKTFLKILIPALAILACGDVDIDRTWTVNFDSLGGSSVAQRKVAHQDLLPQPVTPVLTRFRFAGWYRATNWEAKWDFAADTVQADQTLYARWAPELYTVSFNAQGGSAVAAQAAAWGALVGKPADPTKPEHLFEGWYREALCHTAWDFGHDPVTNNTMLFAKWFSAETSKAFLTFGFVSPATDGFILPDENKVFVPVPPGTSLTALVAFFTHNGSNVRVGATPQTSGATANDFTSPVDYTITALDGTTQEHRVTVTVCTPGLVYSKSPVMVSKGTANTAGSVLVPESWLGIPVTALSISAFDNCNTMTNLILPASITTLKNYAVRHCHGLTNLVLPAELTSIGDYVFQDCDNLAFLQIPAGVTSLGHYVFSGCDNLAYLVVNPVTPPGIGTDVFHECTSLTSIRVPAGSVSAYQHAAGWSAHSNIIVAQ